MAHGDAGAGAAGAGGARLRLREALMGAALTEADERSLVLAGAAAAALDPSRRPLLERAIRAFGYDDADRIDPRARPLLHPRSLRVAGSPLSSAVLETMLFGSGDRLEPAHVFLTLAFLDRRPMQALLDDGLMKPGGGFAPEPAAPLTPRARALVDALAAAAHAGPVELEFE